MVTSATCNFFLPEEILENILLRLPVKFLKRFTCVSKTWKLLISDHGFVNKHLHSRSSKENKMIMLRILTPKVRLIPGRYPLQIQTCKVKKVWGSCDGLLLLTLKGSSGLVLWNPSTREYKKLPDADEYVNGSRYGSRYVIGYNSTSMDYEVIKFWPPKFGQYTVQIYSLRSNSWKRIQDISYHYIYQNTGVIVDGKLHFLARIRYFASYLPVIIAYDFREEFFYEVPLHEFEEKLSTMNIATLDGKLCLLFTRTDSSIRVIEGWVMNEYGSCGSWTKLFRIDEAGDFGELREELLFSTTQGEIVMRFGNSIILYDPKDNSFGNAKRVVDVRGRFEAIMYTESLVSLGVGSEIVGKTDSWAWG